MEKMFFEEPEMEVVRFDAKDAYIATSCPTFKEVNADNDGEETTSDDEECNDLEE